MYREGVDCTKQNTSYLRLNKRAYVSNQQWNRQRERERESLTAIIKMKNFRAFSVVQRMFREANDPGRHDSNTSNASRAVEQANTNFDVFLPN